MRDMYGADRAEQIVAYFLGNAHAWRGETARRIKKELNGMLKAAPMIDTSKPVDRTGNVFCGPLVVAAILDKSTGAVAQEIQALRKSTRPVKSVRAERDLFPLLARRGVKISDEPVLGMRYRPVKKVWASNSTGKCYYNRALPANQKPIVVHGGIALDDLVPMTLLQLLMPPLEQVLARLERGATFIVRVTGHVLLFSQGKVTETYTNGEWRHWYSVPAPRRKVRSVWRIDA